MPPEIDLITRIELPAVTLPVADPCVIVIFGATGDLTRRKLLPALFHLACEGCMAPAFHVVGVSRPDMDDAVFRDQLRGGRGPFQRDQSFR